MTVSGVSSMSRIRLLGRHGKWKRFVVVCALSLIILGAVTALYKAAICEAPISAGYDIHLKYDGEPPPPDRLESAMRNEHGIATVLVMRRDEYDIVSLVVTRRFCERPDIIGLVARVAAACGYKSPIASMHVHHE